MLKKGLIAVGLCFVCSFAMAQSSKKLSKDESARMTQDQRLVHETNRKSNHGKKKVSTKKKAKISKKQDRRARRMKQPK